MATPSENQTGLSGAEKIILSQIMRVDHLLAWLHKQIEIAQHEREFYVAQLKRDAAPTETEPVAPSPAR